MNAALAETFRIDFAELAGRNAVVAGEGYVHRFGCASGNELCPSVVSSDNAFQVGHLEADLAVALAIGGCLELAAFSDANLASEWLVFASWAGSETLL